jgi:hypothetical protein
LAGSLEITPMKNDSYIVAVLYFFFFFAGLAAKEIRPENKYFNANDTIAFLPHWKTGDNLIVRARLEVELKNSVGQWRCRCESGQRFFVTSRANDGFVVDWYATGFMINMFIDLPGPLFEWADKLQKNDTLQIQLFVNHLGLVTAILNKEHVTNYAISTLNRMLKSFDVSDFKPYNREDIKKELVNTLSKAENNDQFPFIYTRNLQLLFIPYNRSFDLKVPKTNTVYKELPSLGFSVPVEMQVKLTQSDLQSFKIEINNKVQPFSQWRIKPREYNNIDFAFSEKSEIEYDAAFSWLKSAEYEYLFERENILVRRHLYFKLID